MAKRTTAVALLRPNAARKTDTSFAWLLFSKGWWKVERPFLTSPTPRNKSIFHLVTKIHLSCNIVSFVNKFATKMRSGKKTLP
jgi:hypothetical protein